MDVSSIASRVAHRTIRKTEHDDLFEVGAGSNVQSSFDVIATNVIRTRDEQTTTQVE